MSQQATDLRRSVRIVQRRKFLVGILTILGVFAGVAYGVHKPPIFSSTALVVFPQPEQNGQGPQSGQTANGPTDPYTATQELIANSNPVLLNAIPNIHPATSLDDLRSAVRVGSPTSFTISITAETGMAAEAQAVANAVAESYIAYVGSANSPIGYLQARMLAPATSAIGPSRLKSLLIPGIAGGLAAALVGIILALAFGRGDRRLRECDEIANSIGIPVLAAIPVLHPHDAAGWTRLLDNYQPRSVHAWQLRKAVQQLAVPGGVLNNGNGSSRSSFVILTLSSDPGALALGPQLAVFTASAGIRTALVVGPQQDANVTAALRTACAVPPSAESKRPNHLRVIVSDDGEVDTLSSELVVVVTVIDSRTPQVPEKVRATTAVLGVSAGAATAEQLARAAVRATADGREIAGVLVADPVSGDHTTGYIPRRRVQPARHGLPRRPNGVNTEVGRNDPDQTVTFRLNGVRTEIKQDDSDETITFPVVAADDWREGHRRG
jgi:capsular polysaccharide biosynthesis protein